MVWERRKEDEIVTRQRKIQGMGFKIFFELTKFRIVLLITLSTATGFILAADELSARILVPVFGIFLLVSGSSALNQYQEWETDALMERTKLRPIPSGKIKPFNALFISLLFLLSGFLVLFFGTNLIALALSLFAVLWYNGFYTYFKKINAFAVIPGSLIGAIAPAVGWVAGKGSLLEPKILVIAFFFFIWQVPHFWLLLMTYGKDYEKSGLPCLTKIFTTRQLTRIIFIWILATAVSTLLIPLYGVVNSFPVNICLIGLALWLAWSATKLLKPRYNEFSFRFTFIEINIYALVVITLLFAEKLFNPGYY